MEINYQILNVLIACAFGFIVGGGAVYLFFSRGQQKYQANYIEELKRELALVAAKAQGETTERVMKIAEDRFRTQDQQHRETLLQIVKSAENSIDNRNQQSKTALDSLFKGTETKVVEQTELQKTFITGERQLIDNQLLQIEGKLSQVTSIINDLETKRATTLGELKQEMGRLTDVSSNIHKALLDNKSRGQWGERIAEDLLQLMGMQENVNYHKQAVAVNEDGSTIRPDFTFLLPDNQYINMDVKFPLTNYIEYCNCESEADRSSYLGQFKKDVRARVKEITVKEYIDASKNTLDCVIMFIPNEQVYRFIYETDHEIFDAAMQQKVIICSPVSLYVILALLRHSFYLFNLRTSSDEVLKLLGSFKKQWMNYKESMDKMGNHLTKAQEEFNALISTRTNKLDVQIRKIDSLLETSSLVESADEMLIKT